MEGGEEFIFCFWCWVGLSRDGRCRMPKSGSPSLGERSFFFSFRRRRTKSSSSLFFLLHLSRACAFLPSPVASHHNRLCSTPLDRPRRSSVRGIASFCCRRDKPRERRACPSSCRRLFLVRNSEASPLLAVWPSTASSTSSINMAPPPKSSLYRGVTLFRPSGKFRAQVRRGMGQREKICWLAFRKKKRRKLRPRRGALAALHSSDVSSRHHRGSQKLESSIEAKNSAQMRLKEAASDVPMRGARGSDCESPSRSPHLPLALFFGTLFRPVSARIHPLEGLGCLCSFHNAGDPGRSAQKGLQLNGESMACQFQLSLQSSCFKTR